MLSKNNINDIIKLFTQVILKPYGLNIEKQFKHVSKTAAIEYIMFTMINRKNFTPESLRDMYLERNIILKGTFYYDILQIGNLYDQILKIYSNPLKVTEFNNATKKSLSRNEKQQFIGFPSIFKDFYTLYASLINELIST